MKKINVRYLVSGLVTMETPEELLKDKNKLKKYTQEKLETLTNRELLEGLANYENLDDPIEDTIFDETPTIEAIEDNNSLELICYSKTWDCFANEYFEWEEND